MNLELPNDTIFYELEKSIKSYRTFAQNNIQKSGVDITINQLLLLIQLLDNPDIPQVELSEIIFKDVASVTRMIELLVKKKYVNRSENKLDRRKKQLFITKKGKKVIDTLIPVIRKNREIATKGLSDNDILTLSILLNKIINNCN